MDVEHGQQCTGATGANEGKPEESLGISTTSSWTILATDRVEIPDNTTDSEQQNEQRRLESDDHQRSGSNEHTNERLVDDLDGQAEDVSDGISIISDCESTGRVSPPPFLRELNFKFESGDELPLPPPLPPRLSNLAEYGGGQQVRERRIFASELDGVAQPQTALSHKTHLGSETTNPKLLVGYRLPKLVENGLTAVFYVGATLAILAFIGRLRNPEWKVLGGGDKALEQRLVELELQNNLMRAEIDIISKQLLYLNTQTPAQSQSQSSSKWESQSEHLRRKAKTFKAWPGNGNTVDAVDITKDDLKRPYKCPDGRYAEIAAMCIEKQPHAESLADEIGNVVNDVLQQSQAFHNFEKDTEQLGTIPSDLTWKPAIFVAYSDDEVRTSPPDPAPHMPDASKERHKWKHAHKLHEKQEEEEEQQSKECLTHRSNEYDSKERHKSKKHFQKQHAKRPHQQDDDSGSGDWHEGMMQQREHSRKRDEQRRNNNWYIERGYGREQKRVAKRWKGRGIGI